MNETIQTILRRRSVRAYKSTQITEDELKAIIECGMYAPSGMNVQNWHFTVLQNKDLIEEINTAIKDVLPQSARERYLERHNGDENFSMFYGAPTIVFVSGVKDNSGSATNCALAAENMCIAAESMDIGSCIIGLASLAFNTPKAGYFVKELGIPEGYWPLFAISLGYKNMEMSTPPRHMDKVNYIK